MRQLEVGDVAMFDPTKTTGGMGYRAGDLVIVKAVSVSGAHVEVISIYTGEIVPGYWKRKDGYLRLVGQAEHG